MSRRPAAGRAPDRPRLPTHLDDAPDTFEDLDSLYRVELTAACTVPERVADVELVECRVTEVDLVGRTLSGLRCRDVRFEGCDLSGADLDGAVLDRVEFSNCRLAGTALSAGRLVDVLIVDTVARQLNLRAATAQRLRLERTVATEADFYTASLTNCALLDCDLGRARFGDVRIDGLSLHGSTLDDAGGAASLAGARIDDEQVIPLGAALLAGLDIRVSPRPDEVS